ncbi:phage tail protein [Pseudomonas protegens]|uniref:phage tail protein n=1 Tax=Pseudomonas protegens TaxID=380021 RepID=UPI002936F50F|nr:phage tail protein [Pseudomonas protegens]WOE81632.1 phage tail protein [Pseudomonas protegens]
MSQTYFAILTAVGEAKLANATALGTKLQISKMAVGDGNGALPTPTRTQTTLANERYRASLNTLSVDPKNTSQVMAEMVIPETEGGWWIREMGLYDAAGDLIAVSNCPPSYKPQMAEGSGRTQVLRMVLIVSSTTSVQLKIDPSVVLATREYVDVAFESKLPADKVAGTYTQVSVSERGIVLAGANPTTLAGYGITDAYKRLDVDYLINQAVKDLAAKANTLAGYGITDAYKRGDVDYLINQAVKDLAAKANTLAGYGITDAYKKADVEYLINLAVTALLPKRSFTINDFIRIPDVPGGLILQMGTELVGSEASVDITLPLTFNTARGAVAGVAANAATNQGNFSAYASLRSNSTIRVTQDVSTTSAGSNQYIHWFAWGN